MSQVIYNCGRVCTENTKEKQKENQEKDEK